ncbi:LmeA family phospholipid-binding protein [Microbacterium oleivorans]|uniref:LmeA family phospholipid-binding protein n=1 Tax=Microbacterium oleivorans TaxID=273677 RepID=UPI00203C54BA|nr:LmeA family phospholipid-binding protein [Microbacterium oleivorans]MCM3695826.1 DUF2993 domain-containing protein [Microbacterium oleivorans]
MTTVTAPRRRRRGWIVAIVIVAVLAVLVVAAEFAARALVPQVIRSQLVSTLGLPEDQPIDVDIPGLLLPQLVVGNIPVMSLSADDVEVDGISGDVEVTIADAPVRQGGDWSSARAVVVMDEEQIRTILSRVDGFPVDSFRLDPPAVALDTELNVFGAAVPLGVRLSAAAEDGELVLSPTTFRLGEVDVSAEALRQQLGPLVGSFVQNWPVCLAEYLPRALTLAEVTVAERGVVASFDIDSAILRDRTAQQPGSCADAS